MKVLGLVVPKAVVGVVSVILGTILVGGGLVAAVPQVRVTLRPLALYVPAVGPAGDMTVRVEGPSMDPEFSSGQYITVLPLATDRPQRCDVVLYSLQSAPNVRYLKRVIAIGGDTVSFTGESVSVNGNAACPAVLHHVLSNTGPGSLPRTLTVPPNMYFVVGDNLLNSADSRFSGPILRSSIIGYLPG